MAISRQHVFLTFICFGLACIFSAQAKEAGREPRAFGNALLFMELGTEYDAEAENKGSTEPGKEGSTEPDVVTEAPEAPLDQTLPDDSSKNKAPSDTGKGKYVPSKRPTFKPDDRRGDPFSSTGNSSPMLIPENPSNIKTEVTLDSSTGQYTIREKAGDMDVRPPTTMTFAEYTRWKQRQDMKNYMKAKSEGASGQGPMSNNRLIPKIYFNPAFDRIFGGNAVDLKPNGTVVLDFGVNSQQVYNPALPIRQQQNTQFLFDQQISLNVQGKVGEKVKLTINYDTKANFEFDNNVKIDYTGFDNEILQKIELGNVSLPVSSTLITGAQNLFGAKATMKFGRLKVVTVASTQRGKQDNINLKGNNSGGGVQTKDISIRCDEYDANRHFFLSQFFRSNYEKALNNPAINPPASGVRINRVDVYITNKQQNVANQRNIVAFADLGEGAPHNFRKISGSGAHSPTSNNANNLFRQLASDPLLQGDQARDHLIEEGYVAGTDFELLKGARKLTDRDFTFNPQLGYISLQSPLVSPDDIVAVAYEYSYNGTVYTVGQPTGVASAIADSGRVIAKLLRSTTNNVSLPMWDLQMKNIYSLGSSSIQRDGFQMRIIYRDDSTGVDNPALRQGRRIANRQLTQVLNADRLSPTNELQPDGQFDWVPGVTVDQTKGLLIFPVVEPFGAYLQKQFDADEALYIDHYVFNEMYRTTKALAKQYANKAKYFLTGRVQSSINSDVSLNATNLAPGSVKVTAGLQTLTENTDYQVNYQLGTVKIINPAVLASGQDIKITFEKADLFSFQQRSFFGTRLDYTVSKDINIGGTFEYLNERPLIRRVAVGDEPVSNYILGLDVNYKKDSRFLTKAVDALPFIQTKETSSINFSGEYARLIPSASTFVDPTGNGISYIDDFEGARITTDLTGSAILNWKYASTPLGYEGKPLGLPSEGHLAANYNRAKLAWYNIDNAFYAVTGGYRPSNITNDDIKKNYVRAVLPQEVFPNRQPGAVVTNQTVLDLAYYPTERAQYNFTTRFDSKGHLLQPEKNWGGIMRGTGTNVDFDANNTEYMEFWMMDPFNDEDVGGNAQGRLRTGKMFINLGNISEDALPDNELEYENGLPSGGSTAAVKQTEWGVAAVSTPLNPSFDNSGNRSQQDVGLDGLDNSTENIHYANYLATIRATPGLPQYLKDTISQDPSGDDFKHFLDGSYDGKNAKILERYKSYNGMQNNSPVNTGGTYTASSTQTPDNEDINQDNSLAESNSYYKYRIDIDPNLFGNGKGIGRNYIVDYQKGSGDSIGWYLFRVPIRDLAHPNFAGREGDISDFRSIRFVRMFLTGFKVPVVVRMVQFQMVAGTWRPYLSPLPPAGPFNNDEHDAAVTVGTVNIEENGSVGANKVPYVVPPGLPRDRDVTSGINRALNETSLSLCVDRLRGNSAQAVYKNLKIDFLNYSRLRMWVSANTHDTHTRDGDVRAFMRIGTDFTDNYYEIEVPLKFSQLGTTDADDVWLGSNEINVLFAELTSLKVKRNAAHVAQTVVYGEDGHGDSGLLTIHVKGNPDLSTATIDMLGVRVDPKAYGRPKSLCVWFDELRVTDFIKNDGWATTGKVALKLADLGTVTATGKYVTVGFGNIQDKISDRTRNWTSSYNISGTFALDKFLPKKAGLKIPMYASYQQDLIIPKYDPLNPDIELSTTLDHLGNGDAADFYRKIVQDRTTRKSINFTNVQRVKTGTSTISFPWDIENISLTYAYSETRRTNINYESYAQRVWKYAAGYTYATNAGSITPFKSVKALNTPWLKPIGDFNFSLLPSSISARVDLDRSWTRTQLRSSDVFATNSYLLPTLEKNFTMTRVYAAAYSPAKSITLNYTATVTALIDEPYGDVTTQVQQDTIRRNLERLGRTKTFNQLIRAGYKLPIDKLPLTDFLGADVSYTAGYIWTASPKALQDTLGNVIQNSRDRQLNGRIDFLKLYNKSKWLNKINTPPPPAPAPKKDIKLKNPLVKGGPPGGNPADTVKKPREYAALKGIVRILMSVRTANFSYQLTENTILPDFRPTPSFFGNNANFGAPGYDFILGDQNPEIRKTAANLHWLGSSTLQNQPFTQSRTENITGRISLEPLRDLRIQLDAKRTNTAGYQENWRNADTTGRDYRFQSFNPAAGGSYSVSFVAIKTAFGTTDQDHNDAAYRAFRSNLDSIKNRLDNPLENANAKLHPQVKYLRNSQDVLIPSFIAAYSGQSANTVGLTAFPKIPLPNWRLDYAGLTRIPWLASKFSSISLTHAYTGLYSVSQYSSSLAYGNSLSLNHNPSDGRLPNQIIQNGDSTLWLPVYVISSVSITEKFSPLIGINIQTKSKITLTLNYNKDRAMNLNTTNAQINEMNSWDVAFGLGFKKSGIKVPFRVQGRTVVLKNELGARCDVTVRSTTTTQHKLDAPATITAGTRDLQVKPNLNYVINTRLNVQAYVEYTLSTPMVSTSYKRSATRVGVQLRFTLN